MLPSPEIWNLAACFGAERFTNEGLNLRGTLYSAVFLIVFACPGNQGPKLRRELLYSPALSALACAGSVIWPRGLKVAPERPEVPVVLTAKAFSASIQRILLLQTNGIALPSALSPFQPTFLSFIKHLLACVQFRFSFSKLLFSGGSLLVAGGNHRERNEHRQGQNLFHTVVNS